MIEDTETGREGEKVRRERSERESEIGREITCLSDHVITSHLLSVSLSDYRKSFKSQINFAY